MPVGGESGDYFIGREPVCVSVVARQTTVPKSFPTIVVRIAMAPQGCLGI